jgi:hypothetical protein
MPADQNLAQHGDRRGTFIRNINQIGASIKRHPHCTVLPWHMRSAPRVLKSALVGFVAAFAFLAAGRAFAQYGGTSGTGAGGVTGTTGSLAASDFTILFEKYNGKSWVQMNSVEQQYFFNQARCQCGQDPNAEFKVVIQPAAGAGLKIQTALEGNFTGGQGVGRLFAGAIGVDCLTNFSAFGSLAGLCTNLLDPGNYPGFSFGMAVFGNVNFWESPPIPVAYLFNSLATSCTSQSACVSTNLCSTTNTQTSIQFWAQTGSGLLPDFDPGPSAPVVLVGNVPVVPTGVTAEGGNEALKVSWSWPLGINIATDTTLYGVQIFCQRGASDQVFNSYKPAFMSATNVCNATAPTPTTSGPFSNLDPKYLCSGLIPATSNSYRITGLQNGIQYGVGVAAVDRYGNVSTSSNVAYGMPIPTVDFYADYKDAGGSAQGGFCALASQHARPGILTVLCLATLGLVLHLRRRSRRHRRPGAGTLAVLLVAGALTSAQAHAQVGYGGTSFVDDGADEAWEGSPREYAIEARFGLYTPNVDSEFGKGNTPQAFVFGSKRRPMWQFEFDWEFLQEFGTLALGGVLGYYKENALACKQSGLQADGSCNDRSGDNTSLRLIPLAALLVYRMDEGARQWKIPLVPYAKIGLNYTIWTITNGNGDVAWYQDAQGRNTKGQGGTMGWQAAVGISLQLDFIDPSSARGFDADSGVNHTYAFFELDHVDGSGLYRKDVLRVGDDTWFAGLMFEF